MPSLHTFTDAPPRGLIEAIISRVSAENRADACSLLDLVCEAALAHDDVPATGCLEPPPDYLQDLVLRVIADEGGPRLNLGSPAESPTEYIAYSTDDAMPTQSKQGLKFSHLEAFLAHSVPESFKTALMWAYAHDLEPDVVKGVIRETYNTALATAESDTDLNSYEPKLKEQLISQLLRACELARRHSSPAERDQVSENWRRKVNDLNLYTSINKALLRELRMLAPYERDVVLLEIEGFALGQIANMLDARTTDVSGWRTRAHARLSSKMSMLSEGSIR
jgi:hypothetical protein